MDHGIWLALCAFVLAGMVQGSSGFGFSLVAVGLVGMALGDVKMGAVVPVFSNVALTGWISWRLRSHIRVRMVLPFLSGSLIGVPAGVWLLSAIRPVWVYAGIGAVLFVSGGYALLPKQRRRDWHRVWVGVPCGLASGGLSGAFNTGGPPAVAFLSNQSMDRFEFVATLQFVFVLASLVRLGFLGGWGMIDSRVLAIGLAGIAAALLGGYLGHRILHRMADRHLRVYVCVFQLVLGVIYVFRAVEAS